MKCIKCDNEMYKAQMLGGVHGLLIYLQNKKAGILESAKQSTVSCYVCSECGYIELHADDPKGLRAD